MRNSRVFIAILVVTCIGVVTSRSQTVPPIVGTWKLNREKSQMPAVPAGWFDIGSTPCGRMGTSSDYS